MSDDDWGLPEEPANKEAEKPVGLPTPEPAKVEKKEEEKKEEAPNPDLDQSESWIAQKSHIEPDKKPEQNGRSRGRGERGQEKVATVEEKAEELKPDEKNDESVWGEEAVQKEKQEDKGNERTGRGRGNREGQEGEGDRGGRGFNRNYQGQGFDTGRGNRQEENNQRGRGNRDGERGNRDGERGNRNGDGQRGNRNWNGDRGNRNGDGQRGNGFGGGYRGGDRGDRDNRGGNWQNRGDGERGRGRGRGRGGFYNDRNFNNNNQNEEQTKAQEKAKVNTVPLPKGRKCWPESSIYIFGIKLSITFRRVQDFKCKLLVAPFKTPRLEFYPGNIINQSKINYKEKINKKEDLKNAGETYFQKAHEIASFEGIAFLKVDDSQLEESFKKGVRQVFEKIQSIIDPVLQSVVFCVSEELGSPLPIIHEAIQCLQETQKVKEFYINTISPKCFLECVGAFREEMQILFDENEISME